MSAQVLSSSRNLTMIAFDPAGIGVIVPPIPNTAADVFREHPEVEVAIDGPMFTICPGQPRNYDQYQCGTVSYRLYDAQRQTSVAGERSKDDVGLTFSLIGGRLIAARGNAPAPGATVAVQTYPGLVENGAIGVGNPETGPNAESNWRVAMGILRDGRAFFAHGRDSMFGFSTALRDAGAVWAGYTDGGGSASLVRRDQGGRLVGSDPDDPGGRRVPSWVVWSSTRAVPQFAQPQPRLVSPAQGQVSTPVVVILAASAMAAVIIATRRRLRP